MDGAGEMALVPLVLLANVDPRSTLEILRLAGVDLDDAILYFLEKFPVGGHSFKNYSSAPRIPLRLPFPGKPRAAPHLRLSSPLPSPP